MPMPMNVRMQPSFSQDCQCVRPGSGRIEPKRTHCERLGQSVACSGIYD